MLFLENRVDGPDSDGGYVVYDDRYPHWRVIFDFDLVSRVFHQFALTGTVQKDLFE